MESRLILNNFDARIGKIDIKAKSYLSEVRMKAKWYDENDEQIKGRIVFSGVAAIEFSINYFDGFAGAEGFGLYEIEDDELKKKITLDNFERRKEFYLLEGDYDYDEDDQDDMLNVYDLDGSWGENFGRYHVFVQNIDAGVYVVIAEDMKVEYKIDEGKKISKSYHELKAEAELREEEAEAFEEAQVYEEAEACSETDEPAEETMDFEFEGSAEEKVAWANMYDDATEGSGTFEVWSEVKCEKCGYVHYFSEAFTVGRRFNCFHCGGIDTMVITSVE